MSSLPTTLCGCGVQADLENQLQVNKTLKRVQQAAHRDLLFAQDRIAKYQAGCMQLEAQNQYLQQAILTLTAVRACTTPKLTLATCQSTLCGQCLDLASTGCKSCCIYMHS